MMTDKYERADALLSLHEPCTCGHETLPVAWHLGGCPYAKVRWLAKEGIKVLFPEGEDDGN